MNRAEVDEINARLEKASPQEILEWAIKTYSPDVAITSSFGAQSAAILHMAVQIDPNVRVHTVDTGFLFPETHDFIKKVTKLLNLNLTTFTTKMDVEAFKRENAHLPEDHPDYCCGDFKVEATERALDGLKCWIAGVRRSQAQTRAQTPHVELLESGLIKVAPLASWTDKDIYQYMKEHDLPFHPLWEQGYTSIGCYPCTRKPLDPNDPRSGRWAGQSKTECGIHFIGKNKPKEKSDS